MSYLAEFKSCPMCGGEETVARKALAGEPGIAEGQFISITQIVTLVNPPTQSLGLLAPALVSYFDICAYCGFYYCTRVERKNLPLQVEFRGPQQRPPFKHM